MHPITWLRRSCLATIHELGITLPEGEHLYSNWDTELVGRRIVEDELPELYPLDENIQVRLFEHIFNSFLKRFLIVYK